MRIADLQQPPCNASLMGVVKGTLDHYGLGSSEAEAFVLSGHAFVINIHEELCPSGPYCWRNFRFVELLRNLGLRLEELATVPPNAGRADRERVEKLVRDCLDQGALCSVLNLDHQLALGYDDGGFILAQPWGEPGADTTPARMSFGTWQEYGFGPPTTFFRLTHDERRPDATAVDAALDFAVDAWRAPAQFAEEGYGFGADAYGNWLSAIDAGHAGEHGNWWNAVVWGECRERAGDYFQAIAASEYGGGVDQQLARELAVDYRALAKLLLRASDKSATDADKRRFVAEARDLDAGCTERIAARAHR